MITLSNNLLFHTLVELFSVIIAYVIFLVAWESKTFLENRYLLLIGISCFFFGTLDLLHTLSYERMGIFPGGMNLSTQLWIASRYLEGASFLIASLLLMSSRALSLKKDTSPAEKVRFAREIFIAYTGVTLVLLLSIFVFRNFPVAYIEGVGLTAFKVISEYVISLTLVCSLILLYLKRDRFENHVFRLLAASIILTVLSELTATTFTQVDDFSFAIGHYFKLLSFYLIYTAIVSTGFSEPYSILFRELKQSEEALRQKTFFLQDDQGRIYRMLGVQIDEPESEPSIVFSQTNERAYSSLVQNIEGLIGFRFDENAETTFMDGAVEEITGYSKEDFLSHRVKWAEVVVPEDCPMLLENIKKSVSNPDLSTEIEYRVQRKNGEVRWVREVFQKLPKDSGTSGQFQGFVHDITERKKAEDTLQKIEEARIKEIHHRIKNNLQVISSLLSLEAERFSDRKMFEAFRESQNRVASMALIHEELYKGDDIDTLDFAAYLRKLTADLLNSYLVGNDNISLKLDLEQVNFGMDTAIPLGIIVNELVSNSLKHAFPEGEGGEIRIRLSRAAKPASKTGHSVEGMGCERGFDYTLMVADNGRGIPETVDFKTVDSLGLQLVNILVEQIDGCIELKREQGTKFVMGINVAESAEV
ncbi:MASE3 domain-containing protein [Methanosarcina sp. 2.H.A.1B.4]|uniref:MASE3 domain-containing protein n=1 Tax=Methanosarcina sp. 2.H.A.1B.4 TaxID=1483600 RepID=UPI00064FA2FE|nr:MASE3 domain-containing protein [Methanosarcina sp. 2.H.A.1B.4]